MSSRVSYGKDCVLLTLTPPAACLGSDYRTIWCSGALGFLQPFTYCARVRVWSQKRERGIRQPTDSPSQVVVVNAVAASAGRCQRCAPQERCDYSTNLCMPGGVFPPSVSIPPSYASPSGNASPQKYWQWVSLNFRRWVSLNPNPADS